PIAIAVRNGWRKVCTACAVRIEMHPIPVPRTWIRTLPARWQTWTPLRLSCVRPHRHRAAAVPNKRHYPPATAHAEVVMAYEDKTERALPTLLSDLSRETIELVRQEIALGRAAISEKVTRAERGLASLAVGAAILLAGVLILLQAVVNGVAMVLPPEMAPWLAPLLVGIV